MSLPPQFRDRLCPPPADGSIPWQAIDAIGHGLEPSFKVRSLPTPRQDEDSKGDLAEDHGVDDEIPFVRANQATTLASGLCLVGSLRTFASTR